MSCVDHKKYQVSTDYSVDLQHFASEQFKKFSMRPFFAYRAKRLVIPGCVQGTINKMVYLSVCLSVHLSVYLSVCLSVSLSVCSVSYTHLTLPTKA